MNLFKKIFRPALLIIGILCIISGLTFLIVPFATADTTPFTPHDPYTTRVGVFIDSYNNDTSSYINCFTEGVQQPSGLEGDVTLFMENRSPHTIWCVITIKKAAV
jgi:hypothetical protein